MRKETIINWLVIIGMLIVLIYHIIYNEPYESSEVGAILGLLIISQVDIIMDKEMKK